MTRLTELILKNQTAIMHALVSIADDHNRDPSELVERINATERALEMATPSAPDAG